jgi:hypothetical protein
MKIDTSDLTDAQKEMFEERAAIYEYEANLTRDEAEQRAMSDVIRALPQLEGL